MPSNSGGGRGFMSETATPLESALEGLLRRIIRQEIQAAMGQNENGHKDTPALLTVDELHEALKVPKSWIYDRTRRRKDPIPHFKVGRYPRFDLLEVKAWLKDHEK